MRETQYIFGKDVPMSHKQHFRVGGYDFDLSKEDVHGTLKTLKAQPVKKVYIKAWNKEFPVKQALAEAVPGLIRSGFTTQDAVRVLRGVGYEPLEKDE
jgi:hypothetical protein